MTPREVFAYRIELAAFLTQQRKAKGLTRAELAKLSGLPRQTIFEMETAKRSWSIDREFQYMHALSSVTPQQIKIIFLNRQKPGRKPKVQAV